MQAILSGPAGGVQRVGTTAARLSLPYVNSNDGLIVADSTFRFPVAGSFYVDLRLTAVSASVSRPMTVQFFNETTQTVISQYVVTVEQTLESFPFLFPAIVSNPAHVFSVRVLAGGSGAPNDLINISGAILMAAGYSGAPDGVTLITNPDGTISAAAGGGGVLSPSDKNMTPSATTGDEADSGLAVSGAPAAGTYVGVSVNGVAYEVGDGVKTSQCYFSGDNGVTARAFGAIVTGDKLFWNGVIAGFNLAVVDRVDFNYDQ